MTTLLYPQFSSLFFTLLLPTVGKGRKLSHSLYPSWGEKGLCLVRDPVVVTKPQIWLYLPYFLFFHCSAASWINCWGRSALQNMGVVSRYQLSIPCWQEGPVNILLQSFAVCFATSRPKGSVYHPVGFCPCVLVGVYISDRAWLSMSTSSGEQEEKTWKMLNTLLISKWLPYFQFRGTSLGRLHVLEKYFHM